MKAMKRIFLSLLLAAACSLSIHAQENQTYFLHTVEKGQSLYSIASMYGVSQADIIRLLDGEVQSDSNPYTEEEIVPQEPEQTSVHKAKLFLPSQ